jgi:hypothetical protein
MISDKNHARFFVDDALCVCAPIFDRYLLLFWLFGSRTLCSFTVKAKSNIYFLFFLHFSILSPELVLEVH